MNQISIVGLPLETLAEMANEAAEVAQKSMTQAVQKAIDCGRYLHAAKAHVPHGQWAAWIGANFDRDQRTATRYMQLATASETRASISDAASIREALRLIADDRATPDEPAVIVVEPEEFLSSGNSELETIEAEPEPEIEPQERPTIRKVSAEARKIPEDRKPRTAAVAAELVEEPTADDAVVLYARSGQGYVVADADEVAAAALQLHEPMALVRMAVLAVEPDGMGAAIDSLRLAADWLESQIEEAEA